MQDRSERWHLEAGNIGMPAFAGNPLAAGIGVDRQDLRVAVRAWRIRADIELAEVAAEALLAVVVEMLVTEEQHAEIAECAVQLIDLGITQRPGDVDVLHLGAKIWCDATEAEGFVGHGDLLSFC